MSNFLVTIHFAPAIDVPALKVGVSSGSYAELHHNIVDQLDGSQFLTLNDGEKELTAVRVRDIHRVTVETKPSEPRINVNLIRTMSDEDALRVAQRIVDEIRAGKTTSELQSGGAA